MTDPLISFFTAYKKNLGLLPVCTILELIQYYQVKVQPHHVSMTHHLFWTEPPNSPQLVGCTLP
jgi:hypothetical protein